VKPELQETTVQARPEAQLQPGSVDETSLRALIRRIQELERERDHLRREKWKSRATPSKITFWVLLILGVITLVGAFAYTSTILAFVGLGLSFYGMLFLFVRPTKYFESKMLESALSPIRTLDLLLSQLGYNGKQIYLPDGNSDGVTLFVPEGLSPIERGVTETLQSITRTSKGISLSPPGLALARQIEEALGVDLPTRGLGYLEEKLPKVLIESLQIVSEIQMQIIGDRVSFRFDNSVYCDQLWDDNDKCATGCPLCSALGCILVVATGHAVVFEDETRIRHHTYESTYVVEE